MASGGDDQEEKGNSLQRTRSLRFCSISNDDDEVEAKRNDDGEKNMSPRFTLTNSLRIEAIPDGETQAHSQEPDQSLASCGDDQQEKEGKRTDATKSLLPTRSSSTINPRTETFPGGEILDHSGEVIYSQTPLSPAIETQGEGIMAVSGHRNVTSLSQLHLENNTSFSHIPENPDLDTDFSLESRTISSTEGEIASLFSRTDPLLQREPSVHTVLSDEHSMEVRNIPVMLANDGDVLYNTCAMDAVLMMILVMILVHQPLSANLLLSSHGIFRSLSNIVFWKYYTNFNMGAIRRYWANQIANFPDSRQDRLDFASEDFRILKPLMQATEFVIQIEYRCRNNLCRYHRSPFQQCYSTLDLVQRFLGRFVCNFDMFYGILNADIIQMAISNFMSSPEEVDHRDSCPGVIRTMIHRHPPFFFLDVGDMWMSTENTRDLLGRTMRIQHTQYIICAMTIYNNGHPGNDYGHYYNLMYIQELGITVIYDNERGILMNNFSMYQLNQWFSNARNCLNSGRRGYPRETVCLIMLLRIS
ncbi:Hypothetical predicted protein [Mytilus galloprovincialis]|uniref:Uncharacterized protein n=1 Tax=Mytilus galloprovincialis TaxID=29158 RepID=A0A8B6F3B7_MYTGA|nr:Hypothetical predicted protein [Mytilus galloprovincialis]